jgi:hypothetical protein
MDGTPTALKNGSRKCRSKSSAPLGLVHFRELFFCAVRINECSPAPRLGSPPVGSHRQSPSSIFSTVRDANFPDQATMEQRVVRVTGGRVDWTSRRSRGN